jgi:hypothetical protein
MKHTLLQQAYGAILDAERKLHKDGIDGKWLTPLHDALCCISEEISKPMPMAPQWQSITPDEVHEAFNYVELVKHLDFDEQREAWCEAFAAYIESKLKDKNT